MAFQNGDLIVVNRNGIDYKALIDDLIAGDGDIAFNAGDGLAEVGTNATANQTEDTAKTFSVKTAGGIIIDGNGNVIIDPNFNLGTEEHGIGDGAIAFNAGDGLAEAGTNATANQISDTVKTFSVKTAGGIIIDGSGNVIIDPNYNLGTEEHGVGDGAIAFNAGSGLAETGTNATANQIGDTVKTFNVKTAEGIIIDGNGNVIIDPNFNLGTEEHGVGDGAINVNPGPGLEATGANATANQKGDTTRVLSAKTGSGIIIDGDGAISIDPSFNLDGNITPPGDGKITINEFDGKKVGEFTVNQDGPTVITLPEILIPESLHPSGFIDVSQPAPADPEHGDIYIQHRIDLADAVAVASFVGIAGRTVTDGQFVMFGVDDLWHAGGDSMPTEHQADWAETDPNALEYIKNKPDLQAEVDKYAGDGAINVNGGPGIAASGSNAKANQKTDTTRTLAVKTAGGITIDANGNVIIDPNFNLDSHITAPNDGVLTVKDHAGATVGTFTANQAGNTDVTLPEGFSGDYNDLINAPDINDGKLTIKDEDGDVLGEFTANQAGDTEVVLPSSDVHWDDIEGKPCIPECSDCLDCLEAECRYIGTKDPDELEEWLGRHDGYGYKDQCIDIWYAYKNPEDIFDIYIPDGNKNPFCIEAFDHCFVGSEPLHYRLADGTEGTFQTEIFKRAEFPDGRLHIRFIPVERDILPKDQAFEVWIDTDEIPDNITCHHPDHDDWVYWDNIVGVPEDLLNQEKRLPSLPRAFELEPKDLILISRKGHDYAIEAQHAKNYFHDTVPDFNDGRPHIHIINGSTQIRLNGNGHGSHEHHMWTVDGNYLHKSRYISPNQEVIIGVTEDITKLFYSNNDENWAIGPKTDTSKVRIWEETFRWCDEWTGEGAEYLDFSSATHLYSLFNGCDLFNGDLSKANMSNAVALNGMFFNCDMFNQDISGWDVSNVTRFDSMFRRCYAFNQDLRGWNTMNATDMSYMLDNMGSDFYASDNSDLSQWCVPLITTRPYGQWSQLKGEPVWGTCPRGEDHPEWIDIAK